MFGILVMLELMQEAMLPLDISVESLTDIEWLDNKLDSKWQPNQII